MKVKGQLEDAQVHNKASDPSNLPAGLIWLNTTANRLKAYIQSAVRVLVTEDQTQTLTNKTLTSPTITTPTGIVKGDVGLGNVDNTSDVNKPVSTATQDALDLKADITYVDAGLATKADTTYVDSEIVVKGLPSGGLEKQWLRKQSDTDYDAAWQDFIIDRNWLLQSANDSVSSGTDETLLEPTRPHIFLSNASLVSIAGIGWPTSGKGQLVAYTNITGNTLVVKNLDIDQNDIITGTGQNYYWRDSETLLFLYDDVSERWRLQNARYPKVPINLPAHNIDWSQGDFFYTEISDGTSFTFSNLSEGQTVTFAVKNNSVTAETVALPAGLIVTATFPTTVKAGKENVYTFIRMNSKTYANCVTELS